MFLEKIGIKLACSIYTCVWNLTHCSCVMIRACNFWSLAASNRDFISSDSAPVTVFVLLSMESRICKNLERIGQGAERAEMGK